MAKQALRKTGFPRPDSLPAGHPLLYRSLQSCFGCTQGLGLVGFVGLGSLVSLSATKIGVLMKVAKAPSKAEDGRRFPVPGDNVSEMHGMSMFWSCDKCAGSHISS